MTTPIMNISKVVCEDIGLRPMQLASQLRGGIMNKKDKSVQDIVFVCSFFGVKRYENKRI